MRNDDLIQLFNLLDTFPNPVTLNEKAFDDNGEPFDKIIYVNKSFKETIGYSTEDIPTDRVWFSKAYPDPEYQKYIFTAWFAAVDEAKSAHTDLTGFPAQIVCKDGTKQWFNITTQLDHPISDKYRTIIFIKTEAPEKTKLELDKKSIELMRQELLLQTIIDSVPVRLFWKNKEGVYLGCNKAFLNDAKLSSLDDIVGKTDYDMVWKEDAERFRQDDKEVFDSGESKLNYIERQPQLDGRNLMLSTSKVLLKNAQGEAIGVLGAYEDITEDYYNRQKIKEHEKMMTIQSRQAAMGEMLSMIAHQWKQPLSAISTTIANIKLRMALESYNLEDIIKHSEGIEEQVTYLSQTISDFSDFFKPDKGKEQTTVCEPMQKALLIIGKQLENQHIVLDYDCKDASPIVTYPKELQQVFINIIKNASDALSDSDTKDAKIEIDVKSDQHYAYYSVKDNAGGIDEEIMDKIFEPYFSTKLEKNGTGLGLYMSKTIIENHLKGSLSFENIDQGVQFTIKVPLNIN